MYAKWKYSWTKVFWSVRIEFSFFNHCFVQNFFSIWVSSQFVSNRVDLDKFKASENFKALKDSRQFIDEGIFPCFVQINLKSTLLQTYPLLKKKYEHFSIFFVPPFTWSRLCLSSHVCVFSREICMRRHFHVNCNVNTATHIVGQVLFVRTIKQNVYSNTYARHTIHKLCRLIHTCIQSFVHLFSFNPSFQLWTRQTLTYKIPKEN